MIGCHGVHVSNPLNPHYLLSVRESWGYEPSNGPSTWPNKYPTCAGKSQSPIDIVDSQTTSADPGAIRLGGYEMSMKGLVTNSDHTLTFTYTTGPQPYIFGGRLPAGDRYEFAQLHWHWGNLSTQGSEHTLSGKQYPAELHLVHYNTKYGSIKNSTSKVDGLAVLGFFYEVSSVDNGNLVEMLSVVDQVSQKPKAASTALNSKIRLDQLLPSTGLPDSYYYYPGSLTTPTCDEAVLWTVFPVTVPISEAQLNKFRSLYNADGFSLSNNYRPPQPLNGRVVYKRTTAVSTTASLGALAVAQVSGAVAGSVITAIMIALLTALRSPARSARNDDDPWYLNILPKL